MNEYLVIRHGANAANQSGVDKVIICRVVAINAEAAKDMARRYITVYNNQYLKAISCVEVNLSEAELDGLNRSDVMITVTCEICGKKEEIETWKAQCANICDSCESDYGYFYE